MKTEMYTLLVSVMALLALKALTVKEPMYANKATKDVQKSEVIITKK